MHLRAAFVELSYSKDWTPESRRWFTSRLGAFIEWARHQGITEIEDVTAPLVRRYIEYSKTSLSKTGKPLSSFTLHGHVTHDMRNEVAPCNR